jgi:hypothetical protein
VDWKAFKPPVEGYALPILLHRPSEETRRALRRALGESPAPSLRSVATRLGHRGIEGLRTVSRSLCKRIKRQLQEVFWPRAVLQRTATTDLRTPKDRSRIEGRVGRRRARVRAAGCSSSRVHRFWAFLQTLSRSVPRHLPENRTPEGSSNSSHATDGQESSETDSRALHCAPRPLCWDSRTRP